MSGSRTCTGPGVGWGAGWALDNEKTRTLTFKAASISQPAEQAASLMEIAENMASGPGPELAACQWPREGQGLPSRRLRLKWFLAPRPRGLPRLPACLGFQLPALPCGRTSMLLILFVLLPGYKETEVRRCVCVFFPLDLVYSCILHCVDVFEAKAAFQSSEFRC